MGVSNTSKHYKVRDPRLPSTPCFLWCLLVHTSCWGAICQVNPTCHSFGPKPLRHLLAFEHASHHVKYGSVLSLYYSILLWRSWQSQWTTDPMVFTIFILLHLFLLQS